MSRYPPVDTYTNTKAVWELRQGPLVHNENGGGGGGFGRSTFIWWHPEGCTKRPTCSSDVGWQLQLAHVSSSFFIPTKIGNIMHDKNELEIVQNWRTAQRNTLKMNKEKIFSGPKISPYSPLFSCVSTSELLHRDIDILYINTNIYIYTLFTNFTAKNQFE